MTLDVGPGVVRTGDSALDLYADATPEISQDGKRYSIDRGDFLVVGSVTHLPHRSKVSEGVSCLRVLEHTKNPFQGFKEPCRVGKGFVEIEVPQKFSKGARIPFHLSCLDGKWFGNAAKTLNVTLVRTVVSVSRNNFPIPVGNIRVIFQV